MRQIQLSIAGLPVDLPAVTKGLVRLTQARAALADLGSRIGEFSWPLTLPATRDNARIFGVSALHGLGLDKFAAVDYPFELRCQGEHFIGTFRLTSLRQGYTGNLLGVGYSWAGEIGDKKLPELLLAPLSYNGSQLEAILAQDCDSSDIQFPLLTFGNFFAPPALETQRDGSQKEVSPPAQATIAYPLSVDDYLPAVYYTNVLRQIFKDIGWTLTGRILDEPRWRETLIAPAGAALSSAWPYGALLPAQGTGTGATAGHSQYCYFNSGPGSRYENTALSFDEDAPCGNVNGLDLGGEVAFMPVPVPTILSGGTRALDGATATYTAPQGGSYSFAFSAEITSGRTRLLPHNNIPPTTAQFARMAPLLLCLYVRRGGESLDAAPLSGEPIDLLTVPYSVRLDTGFNSGGDFTGSRTVSGSATVYLEAGDTMQLVAMVRRRLIDLPTSRVLIHRTELVVNYGAVSFACTSFDGALLLSPAAFLPPLAQRDVVRDFLLRTDSVVVADAGRRTVTLLTRDELSGAAGKPIDLSAQVVAAEMEFSPAAGAGVAAVVFGSASNPDEPLPTAALLDTVRVVVGPLSGTEQRIDSLFAPVALRSFAIPQGQGAVTRADLPSMSSADVLAQPLAEVAWDVASQAPRLLRYLGPDDSVTVPFQTRRVPLARAEWSGVLRFDQPEGAVAQYYGGTVRRLTRGHLAKVAANISPAQYRALTPGRRINIEGAAYTVETLSQFDIADEAASTTLELLREL